MRALVLVTIAALSLVACRFDVSGMATGDDATSDDDQGPAIDAAPGTTPDGAVIPAPVDAGPTDPGHPLVQCGDQVCGGTTICCSSWTGDRCTAPDDCDGTALMCDGASDCPGQICCSYGGAWVGCADSCLGGDIVCDGPSDCDGNSTCCASALGGQDTCQSFCF